MRIRCACFSTRHRGAAFAYLTSAADRSGRSARPLRVRIGAFIQSGDILTVWVSPEDPAGRGVESAAGSRTSTACFLHVKRASNPSVESTTCFLHVKRASNSGRYPSHQKGGVNSSTSGAGCGSEWRGAANSSGFDRIPVRVGRGSQEHVRKNKFAELVYDCAADHKQVITNLAKLHACKKKNRHAKKTDTAQRSGASCAGLLCGRAVASVPPLHTRATARRPHPHPHLCPFTAHHRLGVHLWVFGPSRTKRVLVQWRNQMAVCGKRGRRQAVI